MSLAWYEKMAGAGRSGQVVSSEKLISELQRLDCRFRQRGSHITFHHDETGTRGTIVYGTRKLWSQKTVADALSRINAVTRTDLVPAAEALVDKELAGSFHAVAMPVAPVPSHFTTETSPDYPAQIIVRARDCPQIGGIITPYDTPENLQQSFADIDRRKKSFGRILSRLQEDDFQIVNKDGVMLVHHPVHAIQALLGPYDPAEDQDPQAILERCSTEIAAYAENKTILEKIIKSRKLELHSERVDDQGVYHRTYISRRFQRGFGARISLETSHQGHVNDRALVGFLDDVDKQFFDSTEQILKHYYGYEISSERDGSYVHATNPMLKGVNFSFPKFDNLLKLRDIFARRENLGEKWYVDSVNRILEQRDDILELVSYGLIFSIEQMMVASDAFYDVMEQTQACINIISQVTQEDVEKKSSEPMDSVAFNNAKKRAKNAAKQFKKSDMFSPLNDKPDYDMRNTKDQHQIATMRNKKMPEAFQYGRVMHITLRSHDNRELGVQRYMVVNGPEGDNMVIFSEEGMNVLKKTLADLLEMLPAGTVLPSSKKQAIENKRRETAESYRQMMPEI